MKSKWVFVLLGLVCLAAVVSWLLQRGNTSEVVIEEDAQTIEMKNLMDEMVQQQQVGDGGPSGPGGPGDPSAGPGAS